MALTINTNIVNDTESGYVLDAKNIKGGYFTVNDDPNNITDFNILPRDIKANGSLCYCTTNSKFYQYNGTAWVEKEFGVNDYNELINKPSIPTKTSDLTNDSGFKTTDTNTTYDLAAAKSKTNGNVTIDLTAGGSGSGTDSITIKGSGATAVTTDAGGVITISSPAALKNPNALTIGGKSYDGSSAVSVTAAELRTHLGIDKALHFIGLTTTAITDNATTKTITVDGKSHTAAAGDVVLYNDNEYVFDGSNWLELGDGSSHALKTVTITAGNGLTGGGDISANRTLNAKAGNGITVDATGINHADTSSQASVTASGRKYITGVTLDTYGHVTGLTTGTETVSDTNQKIKAGSVTFGANDEVNLEAGPNITITGNASNKKITIGIDDTLLQAAASTVVERLISSGMEDPSASITSQYYFKYKL